MSNFNDDEPIVTPPNSGPRPTPIVPGRVQLLAKNNNKAPLEENAQKVLLELTGGDSTGDRSGLDLVAVLDVSGSMDGDKIKKMKTAMQFIVKKLSPIDRLSVVTFSDDAARLCPLRQITEDSQGQLQGLVNGLKADGFTNISAGLLTGLKILADRKLSAGRVVGVMLMSDGEQNRGDAAKVAVGNVPVYTFGFGEGYDPVVLNEVAKNSMGGTFSVVTDVNGLSMAFSQCLAGLLTVVVQDLSVTVASVADESTIEKVAAGSYPQTQDAADSGSVTVTFGDLYSKEVRKVIVDLVLPAIGSGRGADILEVTYSYKTSGMLFGSPPATLTMRRTGAASLEYDPPVEVQTEEARLQTATMICEARKMADGDKLGDARDKLVEAQNALEDVVEQTNPLVDALRIELQQLLSLMKTQEMYKAQGRPYAMSSETSHERQRFGARGGDIESMRLFATPRMDKYLEQAKKFDEDPTKPLPSVDEDVKEEIAANPLAPLAGPITFYIQAAIQALQAIEKLINNGACRA